MENKKSKADKNKKAKARVARINRTKAIVQNELEQELREESNINKTTEQKVHKNKKKITPIRTNIETSKATQKITKLQSTSKIDMPLLIVVLILVALGIVMVLSASAPSALSNYNDSYIFVKTQAKAAILGFTLMIILSKINYKIYKKFYKIIYIFSIAILFTVLIPKIGIENNGARRWISILGFQIQPSEITKIGLIIAYAGYYSDSKNKLNTLWGGCIKPLIGVAIPVLILLVVQNHLSAGLVISFVMCMIIIMGGCPLKYIMGTVCAAVCAAVGALIFFRDKITSGFRSDRIDAWLHIWENTSGTAYQTSQGLYAIGSGGLFGVGLGESKQKYLYIPEAHNDFIFAILAEELGFVGCVAVLILFSILVIRGVLIAMRAEDNFESLVAVGITALIAIQAILNIAVVTNTIPNTGISLPFLSYGGSSLMILLGCIGILLNISKSAKKI